MLKYEPKVSIVIPAYNASNFLAEAIESALNQTYKNYEILVVNDGSKDTGETKRIALSYGERIKYFEKENGGSSSALNVGIKNMTGEWFSWLSHDDLYYPDKLKNEIEFINTLEIDYSNDDEVQRHIIFASADLIDSNGKIIKKATKRLLRNTSLKINHPESGLRLIADPTQDGFHGCSCLVHRKAFEKQGLFDESLRLLNDMDLWFRFYSNGYNIHFIPKSLVKGRVHSKQISRSIGFSYHNNEQDMFWNRSLLWLIANYPERYNLFYTFGKKALLKTRFVEGKKAFDIAIGINPHKKTELIVKKNIFIIRAKVRMIAKQIYLLFNT